MKRKGDSSDLESKKAKKSDSTSRETGEEIEEDTTPVVEIRKTAWEHAKEWFDGGKIVFPLISKGDGRSNDGKFPCVKEWQKTTLEQSKVYLENRYYKNNNWGLLTGERNELFVLDLDLAKPEKEQLSGLEYVLNFMERNSIECSYIVKTGSSGMHFYFKWDVQLRFDKTFAGIQINQNYGIDVRSNVNGQIVLPGSNHYLSGNKYELIKGNPMELQTIDKVLFDHLYGLKYPTTSLQRTITPNTGTTRQESTIRRVEPTNLSIDLTVKNVIDQLGRKRSDSRDDWIRVLLFLKSCGESYIEIAREFSKKSEKYEENAFEREWNGLNPNSNLDRPLTLATFCYWLQEDASYVQSGLPSCGNASFTHFNRCIDEEIHWKGDHRINGRYIPI